MFELSMKHALNIFSSKVKIHPPTLNSELCTTHRNIPNFNCKHKQEKSMVSPFLLMKMSQVHEETAVKMMNAEEIIQSGNKF